MTTSAGYTSAPRRGAAANPAFDVTPAALVHAIVTEHGVVDEAVAADARTTAPGREKGPE